MGSRASHLEGARQSSSLSRFCISGRLACRPSALVVILVVVPGVLVAVSAVILLWRKRRDRGSADVKPAWGQTASAPASRKKANNTLGMISQSQKRHPFRNPWIARALNTAPSSGPRASKMIELEKVHRKATRMNRGVEGLPCEKTLKRVMRVCGVDGWTDGPYSV